MVVTWPKKDSLNLSCSLTFIILIIFEKQCEAQVTSDDHQYKSELLEALIS